MLRLRPITSNQTGNKVEKDVLARATTAFGRELLKGHTYYFAVLTLSEQTAMAATEPVRLWFGLAS